MDKSRKKIELIESDKELSELQTEHTEKPLQEVEIVIRKPDGSEAEDLVAAARLCRCRRVCVTLVEQ